MKFFFTFMLCSACSLFAVQITQEGASPVYQPSSIGNMCYFLPYNPTALFVGEDIAMPTSHLAMQLEKAKIFCVSPNDQEIEKMNDLKCRTYRGLLHSKAGLSSYYESLYSPHNAEALPRIPGSLLPPTDSRFSALFGSSRLITTFPWHHVLSDIPRQHIDLLYLNSGGNELEILKSAKEVVKNCIVVFVKTYHQPFRQNLPNAKALHQFMESCDFVLFSHYIYDNLIGDALYLKKKYFRAVYQRHDI